MKHVRAALLAGLSLTAVSAGVFVPAHAADTTTTFTITAAGGLAISAPGSADLGSVASGTLTVSDNLGTVTVTDNRGAILGNWTATASSTDFAHDSDSDHDIAAASAVYATGVVTNTGLGVSAGAGGSLAAPVVAAARVGAGNNSSSWDPTVTVTLPAQAVVGTYTATVTHSVS
jgi:hypothetical protein